MKSITHQMNLFQGHIHLVITLHQFRHALKYNLAVRANPIMPQQLWPVS